LASQVLEKVDGDFMTQHIFNIRIHASTKLFFFNIKEKMLYSVREWHHFDTTPVPAQKKKIIPVHGC
jgi:hypothetical protein